MKLNRVCKDCECTESFPMNSNKRKRIMNINGKEQLICWMGPSCGVCVCDVP